jgi:hypothetical protein
MKSGWMVAGLVIGVIAVPGSAGATVYTVGAGGSHSSIQGAITTAVAGGGDNEIHVLQGTYNETLTVSSSLASGSLVITGGWYSGFAERSFDPSLTVVDGQAAGSVLSVFSVGGSFEIRGLTLRNGLADDGGGAQIKPLGLAKVTIAGCIISDNVSAGVPEGGGMYLYAKVDSVIEILGNIVENNRCEAADSQVNGAGLFGISEDSGIIRIKANRVRGNVAHTAADHNSEGAGAYFYADGISEIEFSDNIVTGNRSTGVGNALYLGVYVGSWGDSSSVTVRRNLIWDNASSKSGYTGYHFGSHTFNNSSGVITDTVVAGTGGQGLYAAAFNSSRLTVTNVTVADVTGSAYLLAQRDTSTLNQFNTIKWNSSLADDISGVITSGNNLGGSNPLFIDISSGNYQIATGSPAIDFGTNGAPEIGSSDLVGGVRVLAGTGPDPKVDAGASEYANVFAAGFESSTVTRWSAARY